MKNVLLHTDLTVQSLWPVHNIVREAKGKPLTIKVVHLLSMPGSITDLLFLKENKPYRSLPESFREAFQLLSNKYRSLKVTLDFKFVYGATARFLKNFVRANDIEAVYILTNYTYELPLASSVDFVPLLKECHTMVHPLPLHPEACSEYQILSALLYNIEEEPQAPESSRPFPSSISYS
ncbi:hypothetical protein V9K67_18740 [Paraflavisolibacter sp. H34]|uniref:hypothetical protein n=1 Tax=Huijunlia imazamoxiresistens TaxID=3127457 RepID=UPI0030189449